MVAVGEDHKVCGEVDRVAVPARAHSSGGRQEAAGDEMKPLPRPTRYSRQHCGGAGALDRLVQGVPASGRARPRRDGCSVRRRNARARLARAAGLFPLQPAGRSIWWSIWW